MSAYPGLNLGLRLIALSVVASAAVFLPEVSSAHTALLLGILAGALLGWAQFECARRVIKVPGALFVLAQIAVWTVLASNSGGARSPLLIGYILEVPLTAASTGRRGAVLAAVAAAAAYAAVFVLPDRAWNSADLALGGFLGVSALLSWVVAGVLERQQRALADSHALLHSRAANLAEELRLLGDYLGSALIVIDDLGRIVSLNRGAMELLGTGDEDVIRGAWQAVLKLDSAGLRAVTRTLAEGVDQHHLVVMLEDGNGAPVAVRAELWVGSSAEGRRTYVLLDPHTGVTGDVDPVRRLGEAVTCVSHQIKNSIHGLQGLAASVIDDNPTAEDRASLNELLSALRGLGGLAEDMLDMSGAPRSRTGAVRIREVLSSALVLARRNAAHAELSDDCEDAMVQGNRGELVHALFNLLDNAARVSPRDEPVRVRVRADATHAYVEIEDSGPGLPAGLERAQSRAPSVEGSGYGLFATRRFLESNGGELSFERPSRGGTRCRVRLPRADSSGAGAGGGEDILGFTPVPRSA